MKKISCKTEVDSLNERETQSVEMISYFDDHLGEHKVYFATFEIDMVRDLVGLSTRHERNWEDMRKDVQDYIIRASLQSIKNPMFYNVIMCSLCMHDSVKEELINYPNGGWAVIGNFDYKDPSFLGVSIIHPDEFNEHLNTDNSIEPFNGNKTGITLKGDSVICNDLNEGLFLSCLVELIKAGENNCCHHSNEDLLEMIPIPLGTCDRVAQILGKLEKLGIIGIIIYKSKGREWYRDLFLKFPANHILFPKSQTLSERN